MATEFDIARAAASVYAESLLQLAIEAGTAESIGEELTALLDLWHAEPAFRGLMSSAAIDDDARRESIRKAFGEGRVSTLVLNLLLVLNDKWRSAIFPHVVDAYHAKLDAHLGREIAHVLTAVPLEDNQRQTIRREVKRLTGKDAILREQVEPGVLGGLRLQVGDRLYDLTVRRRLADMRKALHAAMELHRRQAAQRLVTEG